MANLDIIKQYYPSLIQDMPNPFDSHQFFAEIIARYPVIYTLMLNECHPKDGNRERTLHSQLAKALKKEFSHLVQQHDDNSKSINVKGYNSSVARWRRISF